jgi:hypothetical protein
MKPVVVRPAAGDDIEAAYLWSDPGEPNIQVDARAVDMLKNDISDGEIVVLDGEYFVLRDGR